MSEIICHGCGSTGHATWLDSVPRQLAQLSEKFANVTDARQGAIPIDCKECGTRIQLNA